MSENLLPRSFFDRAFQEVVLRPAFEKNPVILAFYFPLDSKPQPGPFQFHLLQGELVSTGHQRPAYLLEILL